MARTSKITNEQIAANVKAVDAQKAATITAQKADEMTAEMAEKAAFITATRCRKCNKPLPNADDQATVSREGKVTCKDCIGKNLADHVSVVGATLMDGVADLNAALARNSAPAPAPTTGMVPLSEQLTDTEKKAKKAGKVVTVPLPTPVAGNKGVQPMPTADVQPVAPLSITQPKVVEQSDDSAEARKMRAREFIINTVTQAAAGLIDTAFHTEVLKQLARINPPVLSDDKKAEQLETLKRARAIWAEQTAAKRAAAAKAKK